MHLKSNHIDDNPGVRIPPPFIVLGWWLVGYFIHTNLPFSIVSPTVSVFGLFFFWILGMSLLGYCILKFKRAKTHLAPWRETTTIISTGIYAWSRNPIYLGFLLISIGGALGVNSFWTLLSTIPAIVTLQRYVIIREERYLERKFGDAYLNYKQKVRRWI